MELEKEVRFLVSTTEWGKAMRNSQEFKPRIQMLDITLGAYGRESVAKTGKVFRVRQKPHRITLEIKNRIEDGWEEESIVIDSVEKGLSFLRLAGMKPYLFISRLREIRKYKDLKIFFDDIELLGRYIEIEYQNSKNAEIELKEFLNLCGIRSNPQPLYGEIINEKYDNDPVFRKEFNEYLNNILSEIK